MIHAITFAIAVNIVFLPMHWLGLNGMPRRIPDYPDGYIGWNSFITLGTFLTFVSLIVFLYIIAVTVFNPNTNLINNKLHTRWVSLLSLCPLPHPPLVRRTIDPLCLHLFR